MHFHIVKMYKDKEVKNNVKNILLSMCDVKVSDIYFTDYSIALTTILPMWYRNINFLRDRIRRIKPEIIAIIEVSKKVSDHVLCDGCIQNCHLFMTNS
jgi:ferredoxin-fold anticodon binding domain-containing protein